VCTRHVYIQCTYIHSRRYNCLNLLQKNITVSHNIRDNRTSESRANLIDIPTNDNNGEKFDYFFMPSVVSAAFTTHQSTLAHSAFGEPEQIFEFATVTILLLLLLL
jgi:uncharacterized membrane protein